MLCVIDLYLLLFLSLKSIRSLAVCLIIDNARTISMKQYVFVFVFCAIAFLQAQAESTSNLASKLGHTTLSGNTTAAPFGAITGYASKNVPAYSNGNDSNYVSDQYNFLYGVYMGIEWQCVEYARRWLFVRKGCVFESVVGAADMWTQLKYVQRVVDGRCFALKRHPNGSPHRPTVGSLIIYKRSYPDSPFGHVAVIVDVLPGFVRVAEENYYPYYWSGNYSRQIPYEVKRGSYSIKDDDETFGWMSVEDKNHQIAPLDQATISAIIKLNETAPNFLCPNKD